MILQIVSDQLQTSLPEQNFNFCNFCIFGAKLCKLLATNHGICWVFCRLAPEEMLKLTKEKKVQNIRFAQFCFASQTTSNFNFSTRLKKYLLIYSVRLLCLCKCNFVCIKRAKRQKKNMGLFGQEVAFANTF